MCPATPQKLLWQWPEQYEKELKASTKFNRSYTDSLRPTAMHGVQVDEMSLQM